MVTPRPSAEEDEGNGGCWWAGEPDIQTNARSATYFPDSRRHTSGSDCTSTRALGGKESAFTRTGTVSSNSSRPGLRDFL
jgi:hypothetical protein